MLAGAEAVVVGNTGAAHLAAAVDTPVVSLFAPVVPAVRWRPYRVRQVLLGDQDAPCRDTRARDCPVPGHPCLTGVEPEDVRDAVRRLRGLAPPEQPLPPPLLTQGDEATEEATHVPFDLEAAASSPCLTPSEGTP